MAVDVEMTDDIRKYDTKSFGPFTTRQVVCIAVGLAYSIPIAILAPLSFSDSIVLMLALAAPAIIAGYVKMNGCPFEVLVIRMAYWYFLTPRKRKYKAPNTYREALNLVEAKNKRRKLKNMTEAERKKYMEKEEKKKNVVYSRKKSLKVYK